VGKDAVALLIPWYANGTLGTEERRQVESHLPGCANCRDLLDHAHSFLRAAPAHAPEDLTGHVQTQLLAEFAEDPDFLGPEIVNSIRSHLESCTVCRDAHHALGSLEVPLQDTSSENALNALWRRLSGSVLHPVAAVLYLAAVLLAYPVYRFLRLEPPPAGAEPVARVLPSAVPVEGETAYRGLPGSGNDGALPLVLGSTGAPGGGLLLELHTDVDPEDLRDPKAVFDLRLLDGERMVWSEAKRGNEFDRGGVLRVLLSTNGLAVRRDYVLALRLEKPGSPPEDVFRRAIRILEPSSPPQP